jgi:hypothetical protein
VGLLVLKKLSTPNEVFDGKVLNLKFGGLGVLMVFVTLSVIGGSTRKLINKRLAQSCQADISLKSDCG